VWKHAPNDLGVLLDLSRTHGDRLFTILEDERVSYEANYRATAALARAFQDMGVGKGDRVAFATRNLPEWPVIFFAITTIGAIAVPLNAWWTGAELEYGINDSGAKVLLVDAERYERIRPHLSALTNVEHLIVARSPAPIAGTTALESIIGGAKSWADLPADDRPRVEIDSDDDATIFYTSGTTGNPKGALGTHRNLVTNIMSGGFSAARSFIRRGEPIPEPIPRTSLTVIPMFHVTACSAGLMGTMASGSTTIFMRKWDTVKAMEIIEREKVNMTGGVPTIAWQLLEHPDRHKYDLSSIEAIAYGGAPSAPELVKKIYEEFGALPGNGWGMTETMATVTSHSSEDYLNRPTSAGPPVATADLEIRAEDGVTVLPTGEVGELWARGPMIVKGYWNKPEASAETFVDGWVRTGDLARLDEEGFLFIVDRAKDMVIRGGENIYPREVEEFLYRHPKILDVQCVGVPDARYGEELCACIILRPGVQASEEEIRAFCRNQIAHYKVPRYVRFVDAFPMTITGKIQKFVLREQMAGILDLEEVATA
jgi:acyl-CoA synthetase (AMP-forming)/AMP-acid ligase II